MEDVFDQILVNN